MKPWLRCWARHLDINYVNCLLLATMLLLWSCCCHLVPSYSTYMFLFLAPQATHSLVAQYCPHMEQLSFGTSPRKVELQSIIASCPRLKLLACDLRVSPRSASETLQAFLDSNLRLAKLHCKGKKQFCVFAEVVRAFRLKAREQQLLPVPLIECTDKAPL